METNELKPFDKVLVRDEKVEEWGTDFFEQIDDDGIFICMVAVWKYCIPYEGNEHLLGTKNDCDVEPYEPYKPKEGEDFWFIGIFGEIVKSIYRKSNDEDCKLMDVGNCFPTEEAAKPYAEKFKQLLKTRE